MLPQVLLLKRAFGDDCFEVYYQSGSHKQLKPPPTTATAVAAATTTATTVAQSDIGGTGVGVGGGVGGGSGGGGSAEGGSVGGGGGGNIQRAEDGMAAATPTVLPPVVLAGGAWEGGQKVPLQEEHYLPMQPVARSKRRPTMHCREALLRCCIATPLQHCSTALP